MALGFDRRMFLRGGCALLAVGCGRGRGEAGKETGGGEETATDETGSGETGTDETGTDETGSGDSGAAEYPCGQEVAAGGAGWEELPLADWPDLAVVGGWYPVTLGGQALVVAHVEEGCYSAIVRACTHEGTAIEYRPDRGEYVCPAHGAIYAADGEKVSGPQPTGLPVYPCGRVGDSIRVQVG